MKRVIITVLILTLLQTGIFACAADSPQLKRNGDEVLVEGTADSTNELVTLKVYKEDGTLIYIRQTRTDNLKGYSFSFTPNITETENLTILVKCASSENIAEITAPYEVAADIAPPAEDEGDNPPPGGGEVSTGGNSSISTGNTGSSGGGGSGGGGGGSVSDKKDEEKQEETVKTEETKTEESVSSLKDVKGHWGEADINSLYEKGIVTGDTQGNYNPDAKIKRSEFLALAVRAIGLENTEYEGSFSDVSEDAWYAQIVQSALDEGIISPDTTFRPDDFVTRQEMAKIAASVIEENSDETASVQEFSDNADISEWAKPYVEKAVRMGLIKGDDKGLFNPNSGATRAEAATVIKRLYARLEVRE